MSSIQNNIAGKKLIAKRGLRVGVVRSQYNAEIVEALYQSCLSTLLQSGVMEEAIVTVEVPGAFELPFACKQLIASNKYDVVIALGVLIKGETPHFDFIASACAEGLMKVGLKTGVPVIFGVLTTNTLAQAQARVDKGVEVALAAIQMTNLGLISN